MPSFYPSSLPTPTRKNGKINKVSKRILLLSPKIIFGCKYFYFYNSKPLLL